MRGWSGGGLEFWSGGVRGWSIGVLEGCLVLK